MSRFARAPERSSPCQWGRSAPFAASRYPGSVVISIPASLAEPDELRERLLVVGPVHREERVVVEERLHRLAQGLDGLFASRSGHGEQIARRCCSPRGRYSARTDEPSGASHVKACLSIAAGTPRQTTACSIPASRRICGICATCPNMSGR